MLEIDVVSIMKDDFIEKDKDRSKYGWLPKMATCSKGSIRSLLASSSCERINSCANQVLTLGNTLLGDSEMEKFVMCRMIRDFMVFMRKNYPQVADEQSNLEYSKRRTKRRRMMIKENQFVNFTVTYLSVLSAHTKYIMTYMTQTFVKYLNPRT